MHVLKKLSLNLGWRAFRVLGPSTYARYLLAFVCNLRSIARGGVLAPLDRAMGRRPLAVRPDRDRFLIDCAFADERIKDDSYTFGLVRELYIRNSYLRHGVREVSRRAASVLDLGANRGAFSTMMACRAKLVIAVECQPAFHEVIARNMAINGFTNYAIESAFVGAGGAFDDGEQSSVTIGELLGKHGLDHVDLVKMDIEGSEFSVFQSPEWLEAVSALCMEVHPQFGSAQVILDVLARQGFSVVTGDDSFEPVSDPQKGLFVWAWKETPKRLNEPTT